MNTVDENTMTTSSDEDEKTTFPKEGSANDEDATTTYDEDITLENDEEDVKTTFAEVKEHLVPMVLPWVRRGFW